MSVQYKKRENNSDPKLRSMDSEWQTDVFAGEFLCCSEVIKDLTWREIQAKCGVTEAAARTELLKELKHKNQSCMVMQEALF